MLNLGELDNRLMPRVVRVRRFAKLLDISELSRSNVRRRRRLSRKPQLCDPARTQHDS